MKWIAALAYLAVGLFIIRHTRARTVIRESLGVDDTVAPAWKIVVFHGIVYGGALLFWPLFLRSWFAKRQTAWDALQQNPLFRECRKLSSEMEAQRDERRDPGKPET